MPVSARRARDPPAAFAMYIAASARRSRCSAVSPSSVVTAMPMLSPTVTVSEPIVIGRRAAARMRSPISAMVSSSPTSSQIATNSSPPRRPSESASRKVSRTVVAVLVSRTSPARCCQGWVSLMRLRSSRSMKNTASRDPVRRARERASSRRSVMSRRLGSPVSSSCIASWRSRSSVTFDAVTSSSDTRVRVMPP